MADDTVLAETIAKLEHEAKEKAKLAEEGDLLYETDMMGARLRRRKPSSMVRSGDTPLPERVPFYRSRTGRVAMLPTAQLAYHLAKRHEDGSPVFVKDNPLPPRTYIEETCKVCERITGTAKQFEDEYSYVAHMESKHPRAYRIEQDKLKRADALTPANLAAALMSMSAEERSAIRTLLGGDSHADPQENGSQEYACTEEGCDWQPKPGTKVPATALAGHVRAKHTATADSGTASAGVGEGAVR